MRLDRLAYKIESISALAGTGCQYSPDAFAPSPAVFAASALCNVAVYNNKPNSLFSEIIGRLNAWCCDKLEISFTVFTETICKILGLTTAGNIAQRNVEESLSAFFHRFAKIVSCKFFGVVKNAEHIAYRIQQSLAVIGGGFIRKTCQIFNVPDKMSDAKLHQHIKVFHIFAISREVITTNNAGKVFAKNIDKHSRTACIGNFEQSINIGAKTPGPKTLFVSACSIGRERWLYP